MLALVEVGEGADGVDAGVWALDDGVVPRRVRTDASEILRLDTGRGGLHNGSFLQQLCDDDLDSGAARRVAIENEDVIDVDLNRAGAYVGGCRSELHHDVLGRVRWSSAAFEDSVASWLLGVLCFQVGHIVGLVKSDAGDFGQGWKKIRCCVRIRRRRGIGGDFQGDELRDAWPECTGKELPGAGRLASEV